MGLGFDQNVDWEDGMRVTFGLGNGICNLPRFTSPSVYMGPVGGGIVLTSKPALSTSEIRTKLRTVINVSFY